MIVLRKSFYIRWSAGRSPRVHEVNPGRDPSVISDVVASRTDEIGDCKHVASKRGDIGDNGRMTCGAVNEGGVEASCANGIDDVDGGNIIVACVDQSTRPPPFPRP